MAVTEFKIEYSVANALNENAVPVIIVAAGSSSRMGGINKMFTLLSGIPVIARTMLSFEKSNYVSEIVVVTKEESIADVLRLKDEYMISKLNVVTVGGEDRLSSVLNGLDVLADDTKGVMIHDGARPLVSEILIEKMAKASVQYDCAVCGVPVKDTLKETGDFVKTLNRSKLVAVQTPQSVNYSKYKELLNSIQDKSSFTDDASVMESAGFNTEIIEGEESNIKITTPFDIKLAELLLKEEF